MPSPNVQSANLPSRLASASTAQAHAPPQQEPPALSRTLALRHSNYSRFFRDAEVFDVIADRVMFDMVVSKIKEANRIEAASRAVSGSAAAATAPKGQIGGVMKTFGDHDGDR